MRPPRAPGAAPPRSPGGRLRVGGIAALIVALVAAGCEPPMTGAVESLAIATVHRDLTGGAACLDPRFLARDDSTFGPVLETALRQRGVPVALPGPDEGDAVRMAVSPIREVDDALALEAARSPGPGEADGAWREWTYRLRCRPGTCTVESRFGPRELEPPPSRPGTALSAGPRSDDERCRN